jgi:hypothetical protein
MKYAAEIGLYTMICIPIFIKTDSAIQKLRRDIKTHRQMEIA